MSAPCPNCHSSHASHYVGDEEWKCCLCQRDCSELLGRQATLSNLIETRFRELAELVSVYKDLIQLRSPIRTMLLGRMRSVLDDIAVVEGMDPKLIPVANLDDYELDEGKEYDEDERTTS